MKQNIFLPLSVLFLASCASTSTTPRQIASGENTCHQYDTSQIGDQVGKDLNGSYFDVETTKENAARWNEKVLSWLDDQSKYGDRASARGRIPSFSDKQIQELYQRISTNKVADYSKVRKYDPDSSIGFCFGRALNVYIEALRMGLAKESVRKVWAVGKMKYDKIFWRYHVATIVKRSDGQWMAIDPEYYKPITVQQWHKEVKAMDVDGKLMLYTSKGNRFGPDSPEPARPGELDPTSCDPRARDLYRGYFKDLMKLSREEAAEVMKQRRENAK